MQNVLGGGAAKEGAESWISKVGNKKNHFNFAQLLFIGLLQKAECN